MIKILNVILNSRLTAPFLTGYSFNRAPMECPTSTSPIPTAAPSPAADSHASTWLESPFRDGYLQQWNFNVQHQASHSCGVTVGYVGSKGTHLDTLRLQRNLRFPRRFSAQANRPYPVFGHHVDSASASSSYHALQASSRKEIFERTQLPHFVYLFESDRRRLVLECRSHRRFQSALRAWSIDLRHPKSFRHQLYLRPAHRERPPAGRKHEQGGRFPARRMADQRHRHGAIRQSSRCARRTTYSHRHYSNTRPDVTCNPNNFAHDPASGSTRPASQQLSRTLRQRRTQYRHRTRRPTISIPPAEKIPAVQREPLPAVPQRDSSTSSIIRTSTIPMRPSAARRSDDHVGGNFGSAPVRARSSSRFAWFFDERRRRCGKIASPGPGQPAWDSGPLLLKQGVNKCVKSAFF